MSTSPVVSLSSSSSESSLDASPYVISSRFKSKGQPSQSSTHGGRTLAPLFLDLGHVQPETQTPTTDVPPTAGVGEGSSTDTEGFFQSLDPIDPHMPSLTPPHQNPGSFASPRASPSASTDDIQAIDAYIPTPTHRRRIGQDDENSEDEIDELFFDPEAIERRISEAGTSGAGPSSSGRHIGDFPPPPPTREVKFTFSAEGIESTMGSASLSGIITSYDFPPGVSVREALDGEWASDHTPGEISIYEEALKCGLRFPLLPLGRDLLQYYNLAPGQLAPNAWRIISCVTILWHLVGNGDISLKEFLHLFKAVNNKNGWVYI